MASERSSVTDLTVRVIPCGLTEGRSNDSPPGFETETPR